MCRVPIALAALVLLALAHPGSVRGQAAPCESRTEGDVAIEESVTRVRRRPRIELVQTRTVKVANDERTLTSRLSRKDKMITELVVVLASDGSITFTRRFGRGFKGMREIVVRRLGAAATLTVDGRPATVQDGSGTPSLVFDDGGSVSLRTSPDTRRLLRKLERVPVSSCLAAPAGTPQPLLREECEGCVDECWLVMLGCEAGETIACGLSVGVSCGVQAVINFFGGSITCGDNVKRCVEQGCNAPGNECCRFHCGGTCCGPDQSAATMTCAGARPDFAGTCCPRGLECGPNCCQGGPSACADPATGLCCDPGETTCGGACCDAGLKCFDQSNRFSCCPPTGDTCGAFCCRSGERCQSPSDEDPDLAICVACPPDKTGPLCGETCCGPGEICDDISCCRPDQLCGGRCCDPQYCLNGTTCCAPPNSKPCGGSCCASFSECCNGVCCAQGTVCTGATCCPRNRRCGNSCCPAGYACTDEAAGTCTACGAGDEPCEPSPGSPVCCPAGRACCTNGACCGAGEDCCDTPGRCLPSFECVR